MCFYFRGLGHGNRNVFEGICLLIESIILALVVHKKTHSLDGWIDGTRKNS